ncbi:hypothetical protein WICMUC_004873 [Wickerhamomyces mucosus]|uniref:Uncharacterized protein n=1 Tax=Wickerhamomyces mucosus TaxID=1378264 RepID=A0A9P8PFJ9_9ASCO|nr:hypothetical protein WICMUC_004873 [Wickerhamomyces mucosus]
MGSIDKNNKGEDVIEIINSFELIFKDKTNDDINSNEIDLQYLTKRLNQQSIILPNEILIGVYEIVEDGLTPSIEFIKVQNGIQEFNELNIGLIFNPLLIQNNNDDIKRDGNFFQIINSKFQEIKSKEAEKIAIDTILNLKENNFNNELENFKQIYQINKKFLYELSSRIEILLQNLPQIKDFNKLRHLNSLISKLNYKINDDLKLNLINFQNNLTFYMEILMILQNLKKLNNLQSQISKIII